MRWRTAPRVPADFRTIVGWSADLDPANRPAVPRELPSDVTTVRGNVTHRQQPHMKIHQSNEHPDLTPVFGETIFSGRAFRHTRSVTPPSN